MIEYQQYPCYVTHNATECMTIIIQTIFYIANMPINKKNSYYYTCLFLYKNIHKNFFFPLQQIKIKNILYL